MDPTAHELAPASSEMLAGEITPFARALGSPEVLSSLSGLAELVGTPAPDSLPTVRSFLAQYRERLLFPVELRAIGEAYALASRGAVRELVALDRRLGPGFGRSAFAEASRHAGRVQLRRLRPLRDRTLQRYLRAVEAGEATGWNVVVYGLLLALFGLPLRQGLVHYATQTQHSLLDSATAQLALNPAQQQSLRNECDAPVPGAVQQVMPAFVPTVVQ